MQDRGAFDLQGFWPHTLLILREVSLLIDILEFILDCFRRAVEKIVLHFYYWAYIEYIFRLGFPEKEPIL